LNTIRRHAAPTVYCIYNSSTIFAPLFAPLNFVQQPLSQHPFPHHFLQQHHLHTTIFTAAPFFTTLSVIEQIPKADSLLHMPAAAMYMLHTHTHTHTHTHLLQILKLDSLLQVVFVGLLDHFLALAQLFRQILRLLNAALVHLAV